MSEDYDFKVFKETPTYKLHDKTGLFKKIIRKSIKIEHENHSSESSRLSKHDLSSESDNESKLSLINSQTNRNESQKNDFFSENASKNIKNDDKLFINYRTFLGKPVKVIRRRQFEPLNYEKLAKIQLESPKLISVTKSKQKIIFNSVLPEKKLSKFKHMKNNSMPLFSLANFKLEQLNNKILKDEWEKKNKKNDSRKMKQKNFFEFGGSKFPKQTAVKNDHLEVLNRIKRIEQNKSSCKYLKNGNLEFLPARKRYKISV